MIGAAVALAIPTGPPYAVTQWRRSAPHAMRPPVRPVAGLPADVAAGETIDGKHLSRIQNGPAYRDLSPAIGSS